MDRPHIYHMVTIPPRRQLCSHFSMEYTTKSGFPGCLVQAYSVACKVDPELRVRSESCRRHLDSGIPLRRCHRTSPMKGWLPKTVRSSIEVSLHSVFAERLRLSHICRRHRCGHFQIDGRQTCSAHYLLLMYELEATRRHTPLKTIYLEL